MPLICYHASHEQFSPSSLLEWVQQAAAAGFQGIHSSDHFHPWSASQGHSGYTFSWIAAAMQVTSIPFSMVCAPGQRLHPAIVAQAIATLGDMFPGRFSIELGSGEAINECITGTGWPSKDIRNQRLRECFTAIKQLLSGDKVSIQSYIHIHNARLYTLPAQPPPLFCAAISEQTCAWAGSWADGLITTAGDDASVRNKINAFRNNGGEGKPIFLQFACSYSKNESDAIEGAYHQWRNNTLPVEQLADTESVEAFDAAGKNISIEQVRKSVPVYTDMHTLKKRYQSYLNMGIERLILHNVNRHQQEFINDFANQ